MADDPERDVANDIWKMLDGLSTHNGQATLARVLIHLCLVSQFTKEDAMHAFSEQWDHYEKMFQAINDNFPPIKVVKPN